MIGNSAYPDHILATAAIDAGLVAQTLQAAGFDVAGARDVDAKSLRGALRDFLDKAAAAGPDSQAFVYLSGRAVQYEGDNYFVPVDARIARDAEVPIEAVKISDFTHALATIPGGGRIVVVDGARATPYGAETAPLAPGLAQVDPEPGELIAFNAAPGTVAQDAAGPYGAYGKALAGLMRQGGVPIDAVFTQVRLQVNQDTGGAVVPWSASNLKAPMYIFGSASDAPPPPAYVAMRDDAKRPLKSFKPKEAYAVALERDSIPTYLEYLQDYPDAEQARRVRAILAARREAQFWLRAVGSNEPRAYWTYLRRYPNGPHVADAQRRLAILAAQFAPPPDFVPVDYDDLPPPPPEERFYEAAPVFYFGGPDFGPPPPPPPIAFVPVLDNDWRDLPPPPPPAQYGYLPVLSIAIPLLAGAVILSRPHGQGAPAFAATPARPGAPFGPPRLPGGVRPVAPPPPLPGAARPMPLPVAAPVTLKPAFATPQAPATVAPTPPIAKPAPTPSPLPVAAPVPAKPTLNPTPPPIVAKPTPTTPTPAAVAPQPLAAKPAQTLAPLPAVAPAAPKPAPASTSLPTAAPEAPKPKFTPAPANPVAPQPLFAKPTPAPKPVPIAAPVAPKPTFTPAAVAKPVVVAPPPIAAKPAPPAPAIAKPAPPPPPAAQSNKRPNCGPPPLPACPK